MGFKKKKSFTLAEMLITLGVIGIIAAITIPVLMNSIKDQQFKQMWKKEYSVINQAYERAKDDEGGDISAYFDASKTSSVIPFIQKMSDYIYTLTNCGANYAVSGTYSICGTNPAVPLDNSYKTLSNNNIKSPNLYSFQFISRDGANFYARNYYSTTVLVWVDVNGYAKKPNVLGRDLFGMVMTKDKIIPMGALGSGVENTCNTTSIFCPTATGFYANDCAGAGCSMEYLSQ